MKITPTTAALSLFACSLVAASMLVINKKRKRRYAVRPLNRNRKQHGHYETLVKYIRENDEEQFFKYTRMPPNLYAYLLNLVEHSLKKHPHRNALSPSHRLTMTLHFLAEGCSMQQIAWDYYVGKSTVHCVIKETCQVLWEKLAPVYLNVPTEDDWKRIANSFYKRWNIPNCIGAIDGKHIVIQAPKYSGSDYFSYKKSFSLVLMAACDAFYKFTFVDIGSPGSNHDSTVFQQSGFGSGLMNNQLHIPPPTALPGTEDVILPYFMAADQAFPLHENIMRPFPGKYLDENQNIFNYRLSRGRRVIENTFGILAQRWRILRRPITADVSTCEDIVKAVVVLHNFVQRSEMDIPILERRYCPTGFTDYIDENGHLHAGQWRKESSLRSVGRLAANNSSRIVKNNRNTLLQYFLSDKGCVPWQWEYVARGAVPT